MIKVASMPKVEIGAKFTGEHFQHYDTRAGTFWEVLPPITGDNCLLQRALLAPVCHPRAYTVAVPLVPTSKAPAMPPVAPAKPASGASEATPGHVPPRPMPAASVRPPDPQQGKRDPEWPAGWDGRDKAAFQRALQPGHDEDLSAVESEQHRIGKQIDALNEGREAAGLPRTVRV